MLKALLAKELDEDNQGQRVVEQGAQAPYQNLNNVAPRGGSTDAAQGTSRHRPEPEAQGQKLNSSPPSPCSLTSPLEKQKFHTPKERR